MSFDTPRCEDLMTTQLAATCGGKKSVCDSPGRRIRKEERVPKFSARGIAGRFMDDILSFRLNSTRKCRQILQNDEAAVRWQAVGIQQIHVQLREAARHQESPRDEEEISWQIISASHANLNFAFSQLSLQVHRRYSGGNIWKDSSWSAQFSPQAHLLCRC